MNTKWISRIRPFDLDDIRPHVGAVKVGKELFVAEGPAFVRQLRAESVPVFLDLKFHDIPNTVAGSVAAATRLGVWMVNVHASGGSAMMRAMRSEFEPAVFPCVSSIGRDG